MIEDHNYRLKRFLLREYPLRLARKRSLNYWRERWKDYDGRPGYSASKGLVSAYNRYQTVQLIMVDRRWYLAYNGEPSTGGFDTKQEAIGWFARNGR